MGLGYARLCVCVCVCVCVCLYVCVYMCVITGPPQSWKTSLVGLVVDVLSKSMDNRIDTKSEVCACVATLYCSIDHLRL